MPNIQLAIERSMNDWMKTIGKQKFRRNKASSYAYLKFSPMNCISIFIFILCFIHKSFITIWICLTEIYKMTIACFIPTISVGSTLTHVRFITWTTQCTCWLVVSKLWQLWIKIRAPSFGAITRICSSLEITISCTKFLAPLPGIVRVWTIDGLFCCLD